MSQNKRFDSHDQYQTLKLERQAHRIAADLSNQGFTIADALSIFSKATSLITRSVPVSVSQYESEEAEYISAMAEKSFGFVQLAEAASTSLP